MSRSKRDKSVTTEQYRTGNDILRKKNMRRRNCEEQVAHASFPEIRCCLTSAHVGARATRGDAVERNVERRGCWRRGRTWRVWGDRRVGTTSPGRRARPRRAAARIGRVCLRARNRRLGRQGSKKTAAGRGDIRPPHEPRGTAPHGIARKTLSPAEPGMSSKGDEREGRTAED